MKKIIIFALVAVMLASGCFAESIVLKGYPFVRGEGTPEGSSNTSLTDNVSEEYKVIISKDNGKYYWLSRENKPLLYSRSGIFHLFVNPDGSGYIKVAERDGKYLYMEHMSLVFGTVTYWGTAEEFKP